MYTNDDGVEYHTEMLENGVRAGDSPEWPHDCDEEESNQDSRGIFRGQCKSCRDCDGYRLIRDREGLYKSNDCGICGCKPTKHASVKKAKISFEEVSMDIVLIDGEDNSCSLAAKLNNDTLLYIFTFLSLRELFTCSQVEKALRNLISAPAIWSKVICRHFETATVKPRIRDTAQSFYHFLLKQKAIEYIRDSFGPSGEGIVYAYVCDLHFSHVYSTLPQVS